MLDWSTAESRLHGAAAAFAIVILGIVVYAPALTAPWYMDDLPVIVNNAQLRDLAGCFSNLWSRRGPVVLSFALNYHLTGLDPTGFRLVNLTLHLVNAWLVYLLLARFLAERRLLALLGAFVFLSHPLQTQAVDYIVQRMAVMATTFVLLTLLCHLRMREQLRNGQPLFSSSQLAYYLAALTCSMLAVLCKENTAPLPLLLLIWNLWHADGRLGWRREVLPLLPFLAVPIWLATVLVAIPLGSGKALVDITHIALPEPDIQPLHYLVTEFVVIWRYLALLVVPWGQAFHRSFAITTTFWSPLHLLAGFGLAMIIVSALHWRRRQPLAAFGVLWFFFFLAVESTVIPLDPYFEHRLYLPLFGALLVLFDFIRQLPARRAALLLIVIIGICSSLTFYRNILWGNPVAFFSDNLRREPDNARAMVDLAHFLGNTDRAHEVEPLLQRAIAINPKLHAAYLNLIEYHLEHKQLPEALTLLDQATKVFPGSARVFTLLADFYLAIDDRDKGIWYLRMALAIDPNFQIGRKKLGLLLATGGDAGGENELRRAIELMPEDAEAHNALAVVLRNSGRLTESRDELRRARRLAPGDAQILTRLLAVELELGHRAEADRLFAELQRLDPSAAAALKRSPAGAAQ